jgi:transmembrane 9 superfamily member 2/4
MLHNSSCNVLCHAVVPASEDESLTGPIPGSGDGSWINDKIMKGYSLNWLIDGLPAARIRIDPQSGERFYSVGFELGSLDNTGAPLLNTHYDIIVEYHVCPLDLD